MLAVQLIGILVVVIWGAVLILRGSLTWGCVALLVASACCGRQFLSLNIGPLPLSIDRVMLLGLIAWYLIHRSQARTDPKPFLLGDWLFLALIGWLTFSTLTHDYTRTFGQMGSPLWKLLGGFWMPASIYWIARQSPLDERRVSAVHWGLAVFGVYLAATGVFEITQQWWLVFPRYISSQELGIHFGRARGPMLSSVVYGTFVSICLIAAWACWYKSVRLQRVMLLLTAPLFLAAVFFCYTRSVWVGLTLALLVVATMSLRGRLRLAVLGTAVGCGLLLAATRFEQLMSLEREQSGSVSARSAESRLAFAFVSWKMFQDKPLSGCGFGQFPVEKLDYLNDRNTELVLEEIRERPHHSTLLSVLTETGVIGMVLFLAVLLGWLTDALRLWRSPDTPAWAQRHAILLVAALAIYTCQAVFHDFTYRPEINYLLFFLAGITRGCYLSVAYGPERDRFVGQLRQDLAEAALEPGAVGIA